MKWVKLIDYSVLIEYFVKSKNQLTQTTQRNYTTLLHLFLEFCEQIGLDLLLITGEEIMQFLNRYTLKSTKVTYYVILHLFYRWCIENHLVYNNPFRDLKPPNGKKKQRQSLSESEFALMLQHNPKIRDVCLLSTLWYTGMRGKELRNLRIIDIDLQRNLIYVSKSKTFSGQRYIPIHPKLRQVVLDYIRFRKSLRSKLPWVFLTKDYRKIADRTIIGYISKYQNYLPFHYTCHDFRRSFITRLYNKSGDIILCQRLAGHVDIKTTQLYIISDIQRDATIFNNIDF